MFCSFLFWHVYMNLWHCTDLLRWILLNSSFTSLTLQVMVDLVCKVSIYISTCPISHHTEYKRQPTMHDLGPLKPTVWTHTGYIIIIHRNDCQSNSNKTTLGIKLNFSLMASKRVLQECEHSTFSTFSFPHPLSQTHNQTHKPRDWREHILQSVHE